jgi:hypothetical protein
MSRPTGSTAIGSNTPMEGERRPTGIGSLAEDIARLAGFIGATSLTRCFPQQLRGGARPEDTPEAHRAVGELNETIEQLGRTNLEADLIMLLEMDTV